MTGDALRTHLDYTSWASRRITEAAHSLTAEELVRDFGTADRNFLGTLSHVYAADRIWLARVRGTPSPPLIVPESEKQLQVLEEQWPALMMEWKEWASALTEDSVGQTLAYRDLKGNSWKSPVWQIVLHVVNHATHHRGQAAGFVRAMGHVPPALDLMAYYRGL